MVLWFTKAMNFLKGLQQESQRAGWQWTVVSFSVPRSASYFWIMDVPKVLVVHVSQLFSVHIFDIFFSFIFGRYGLPFLSAFHTYFHSPVLYFMTYGERGTGTWEWGCSQLGGHGRGWTSVYNSQSQW